jgi:ABC-type transport system involved in cytochrome bd biosynthesis fused ATPase/permease subunit
LLPLMLLISIAFGLVPLAGIVWIVLAGAITSVDGLFMSLILLTLSGVFLLNAALELRDRGLLPFLPKPKAAGVKAATAGKAEE